MSRDQIEQAGFTPEQAELLTALLHDKDARIDALRAELAALSVEVEELRHLRAPVLARLLRDEISSYLAARGGFGGPAQSITFDLICLDAVEAATLTRRDLYLDPPTLDRHYEDSFARMGSIPANKASRFVDRLAVKLSDSIGARQAERAGVSAALLTEALFHSVAMEAARLIPIRHMARRLARLARGETVLIPLAGTTFTYLRGHELEPFYLAAELQRRGVPVAFVLTDPDLVRQAREQDGITLQFAPDPALWPLPPVADVAPAAPAAAGGRIAIAGAGIRGFAYILPRLDNPIKFQSPPPYIMDRSFGEPHRAVLDPAHLPVRINLPFRRVEAGGQLNRVGAVLAGMLPHGDMGAYLVHVLGGVVNRAFARMMAVVREEGISEAHICEHPFFETAVLSHAVRENGGTVTLWPHSWGLSWWGLTRHPGTVKMVYSIDRTGAAIWRERLPGTEVKVVSDLYLPRYRAPRPVVAGEPLNVVIIGNNYSSGRLPTLDQTSLEAISRKLFAALATMPGDVRWTYRPRGTPDLQWQWELAGRPADFNYTTVPPALIDLPNMIFLFPGLLSSALIEGINRGIPALIAREDETIQDYLGSEVGECVPRGSVSFIAEEIMRCRDPVYRQALIERQVAWCEETEMNWVGQ